VGNPHAPFDEAGAGNWPWWNCEPTAQSKESGWKPFYLLRARQFPTLPTRIQGELLMLGIELAQSTVAKYMVPRSRLPPPQSWKTLLRNHAVGVASIDLFVAPTAFFKLLYGLVILGHEPATDRLRHHRSSDRRTDCARG
jgi:hypothetical protein